MKAKKRREREHKGYAVEVEGWKGNYCTLQ